MKNAAIAIIRQRRSFVKQLLYAFLLACIIKIVLIKDVYLPSLHFKQYDRYVNLFCQEEILAKLLRIVVLYKFHLMNKLIELFY